MPEETSIKLPPSATLKVPPGDDDLLDVIGVHVYIEDGLIGVKGAAVDGGDGGYIGNVGFGHERMHRNARRHDTH